MWWQLPGQTGFDVNGVLAKTNLMAMIAAMVAVAVAVVSEAQDSPDPSRSWVAAWEARQAQEAERRRIEQIRRDYERRRAIAHARMCSQPDTMFASRPDPAPDAMCPVMTDPEARRAYQRDIRQRREDAFRRATGLPLRTGLSVHPVKQGRSAPAGEVASAMAASPHTSGAVFASASSTATGHMVPFFPSASDALGRQGFARVINHSDEAGAKPPSRRSTTRGHRTVP